MENKDADVQERIVARANALHLLSTARPERPQCDQDTPSISEVRRVLADVSVDADELLAADDDLL